MTDEVTEGFVKKQKIFLVPNLVGDRFLNTDEFDFMETKNGKGYVVVEEKDSKSDRCAASIRDTKERIVEGIAKVEIPGTIKDNPEVLAAFNEFAYVVKNLVIQA